jgi:hypothetical protein
VRVWDGGNGDPMCVDHLKVVYCHLSWILL